jgi:hypothetical protein
MQARIYAADDDPALLNAIVKRLSKGRSRSVLIDMKMPGQFKFQV